MSIKINNSVAKMRKTVIYNTNVDDLCTKLGLILSICSQDIEKKNANLDLVNDNVYIKFSLN